MSLDAETNRPFDDGPFEGTFTAAADDIDSDLYVKVAGYDGGRHHFGPVLWRPHGEDFPAVGDTALIIRSNRGRWWVLQWQPST